METSIKNTLVTFHDLEYYIYYFLNDDGIKPGSDLINLTLGSEDDEFERIVTNVPSEYLNNESLQKDAVKKIVLNYLENISKSSHSEPLK
jgi:hypothetical protein